MNEIENLEKDLESELNHLDSLALAGKDRTKLYKEHLKKYKMIKMKLETIKIKN